MVFVLAWVEGIGKWLRWMRFVKSFTRIRMSGKMYYLESTTVSCRDHISNLNWDSHDAREGEREREREREGGEGERERESKERERERTKIKRERERES